jgi:nitroreductase
MAKRASEKPLSQVIQERRATDHFEPIPVHDEDLKKILQAGLEAPSGYNLQPWRFVVVRDPEQKKKLRAAAMGQPKVEEAGAVIVACGDTQGWRQDMHEMSKLALEHGYGTPEGLEQARKNISSFLGGTPGQAGGLAPDLGVWVNRHTTIAWTTMMWMAEALGYDTAPMEGFLEDKVKELLKIPASVRVVALLAVGRRKGEDKPYGGRFPMSHTVFGEEWGKGL